MTTSDRSPADFVLIHWMRDPDGLTALVLNWWPDWPPAWVLRVLLGQYRLRLWWRRR